ncbi:hypothetical protein [Sphingosinicella sp. BN140058]|uniref:hypothetical protein n=1 Tax=Sphingosinicella sp. BN140058 TaxID=1892855 RepID=UPI0010118493|nr:hypothetical protein [Sphingosinicella sp. BN140058]QAY77961.1 hypothetical protein ETR14_16595 [Sphingosinicella sp. BN140058]
MSKSKGGAQAPGNEKMTDAEMRSVDAEARARCDEHVRQREARETLRRDIDIWLKRSSPPVVTSVQASQRRRRA